MRRKPKPYYPIEKHTPWFFWAECKKCKQEFRREKGFRFIKEVLGFRNSLVLYGYLCSVCAPSKQDAIKFYIEWRKENPRIL